MLGHFNTFMLSADFFPKSTFSKTLTETLSDDGKQSVSS